MASAEPAVVPLRWGRPARVGGPEISPFTPWKLLKHLDRVEAMLRGEVVYPVAVELDLSNICNHGCPWCYFNGYRQEAWTHFPRARLLTLLDELRECGVLAVTLTGGGEPLVHPDAPTILARLTALGFEWGLVTNGRRLTEAVRPAILAGATFVRVSLDAGTTQTHQLLHATAQPEFERILDNLAALAAARANGRPLLGASFCVFDVNVDELPQAAARVKATGADYLEVRPVFPTEWRGGGFANPLQPEHLARARQRLAEARAASEDERFRVYGADQRFEQVAHGTHKAYARCHIGPLTTVIGADGQLYHCCQQRGRPAFAIGNVRHRTFRDVWLSAAHRALIDQIDVGACPPCRYDGYNEIIERGCVQDGLHANFL